MAAKRKLSSLTAEPEEPVDPADELMFLCLGGGNEVGRSCHIVQYKGKTVMLDAGQHPAYDGLAALPYYDEFDLSTVDVLLISHFHVDHAASLPYVLAKTNFRGRVFMTHPTKAIYKWLISDSVRVGSSAENKTELYTEADHLSTFPMIEAIDYYSTHTISSIRITPYPAGHVLGAAMFLIEIAGLKILFTGDYSREEDRHLVSAEVPKHVKIDVLITESTFGISSHIPRVEREAALMKSITGILNRGGRVLMPVFALGRAQELLLILNEYWTRHPEYRKVPIYYNSNLARKCMVVYQTYIGAMNENMKRLFRDRMAEAEQAGDVEKGGPWDLEYVRSLKNLNNFDDAGECVMLASPGMLQNGFSRELLERWAPNERNGVVITGYSVEGTMARKIMNEPESIPAIFASRTAGIVRGRGVNASGEAEQPMIPRRCSVEEFSFAAHVDGQENREFIEEIGAPVVILVHGEKHNMMRLKSKLLSLNTDKAVKTKIYSPANTEELRIPFKTDKVAKVVGKLAEIPPPKTGDPDEAQIMSGVLIQSDFKMSLMAAEDLREYAGLTTTTIICKQKMTLAAASIHLIRWALEGAFGTIEDIKIGGKGEKVDGAAAPNGNETNINGHGEHESKLIAYLIMGCVIVQYQNHGEVSIEWEGNMLNDGVADAVIGVLQTTESSPAAVKQSSKNHHHHGHASTAKNALILSSPTERFTRLCMFLESQFGPHLTPIIHPKLPPRKTPPPKDPKEKESSPPIKSGNDENDDDGSQDMETSDHEEELSTEDLEAEELERLHGLGIPVPGIEIRVDERVAKLWLETLEVECSYGVLRDRVKVAVEKAVETVAPLWGGGEGGHEGKNI